MVKWFQRRPPLTLPKLPTAPVSYPSDIIVETETSHYFVRGKNKFRITSDRVLESWRVDTVMGSDIAVSKFKTAGTLGFRNGTLIRNIANGRIYLISENKRRHVVSPDVFEKYGFDAYKIIVVSQDEADIHDEGEVLS